MVEISIHCGSGSLVGLVVSKSYAFYLLEGAGWDWVRIPLGSNFSGSARGRICPCLVSDWLAGGLSEQTQPTTRLACSNGHECYRLCNDCKQFKLSHKPGVAVLNCGG